MSKQLPLRVCILSLAAPQVNRIQAPDLLDRLQASLEVRSVYGERPDDWQPFIPGKNILDYLRSASFVPNSLTVVLERCETGDDSHLDAVEELAENVDLFVIDPLFFALDDANAFRLSCDNIIRYKEREFCVVIPERLSQDVRDRLRELRDKNLTFSRRLLRKRGQWLVESEERLEIYLERLWENHANGPSAERVRQLRDLLTALQMSGAQITSPPLLGQSS